MSFSPQTLDTSTLLDEIAGHGKDLSHQIPSAREALIAKARSLITSLETPVEAITWMAWAEPARYAAARLAIDLGLFEKLADDQGRAKSSTELATMAGADPRLAGRTLKHLAAMNMIAEVGADKYKPTALSLAFTVPKYRDGIPFCFDCTAPAFLKAPSYLKSIGYKNPEDSTNGPFQYGHDTKDSFWKWLNEHSEVMETFNNHMAGYSQLRSKWMDVDFYPVTERLGHGLKVDKSTSNTVIVDIGGGMGHDLADFKTNFPELRGRFILQDLPEVIKQINGTKEGIEPMVHDFLTPQPIKGARAYYMHSVLHNWTDEGCRTILQQLIPAMEKGYSKLLINDYVVPDVGASWRVTCLDLCMMALLASCERTEAQWHELLRSVGLKITGIWTKEPGVESLIEAVLEDDDMVSRADD